MAKTTDSVLFSAVEREILETALQNPNLSNAEIAEATGARITLVRDTRANYEDDTELADAVDESDDSTETPAVTDDTELNETQAAILSLAEQNPELTNAEIATETGARITLVRDTRNEFEGDAGGSRSDTETTGGDVDPPTDVDTDEFSETQLEILEIAAANPDQTNAEIAAETGTRVTLVRDTIRERGSDGNANGSSSTDEPAPADNETDVLSDVETGRFSGPQLDILETALSNPELTNGEIAERTNSRITLVRDTLYEHEYDDKPWDKDLNDESEDGTEDETASDGAEAPTPSEEPVEIPETTDSELLSDAERTILETTLENPELTNREIATRTESRLTLVRDTRGRYENAVDLPEDSEDIDSETARTETTSEPTERQREILTAVEANPEWTNAEIADETGARLTFVRDTRSAYGDDFEADETVDGAETSADSDETAGVPNDHETEASETTTTEPTGSTNLGLLIVVLLLTIVIVALALL